MANDDELADLLISKNAEIAKLRLALAEGTRDVRAAARAAGIVGAETMPIEGAADALRELAQSYREDYEEIRRVFHTACEKLRTLEPYAVAQTRTLELVASWLESFTSTTTSEFERQEMLRTVNDALAKNPVPVAGADEAMIEQFCRDLNAAHTELMMAQGKTAEEAATLDWPEWSAPANSIRWAEKRLGRKLAKTNAWTQFPSGNWAAQGLAKCAQDKSFRDELRHETGTQPLRVCPESDYQCRVPDRCQTVEGGCVLLRHQSGKKSDKVGRLVMSLAPSDETTEPAKFRTPLCCPVRTTCERERECSGMCAVRCRPGNEFQVGQVEDRDLRQLLDVLAQYGRIQHVEGVVIGGVTHLQAITRAEDYIAGCRTHAIRATSHAIDSQASKEGRQP